MKSTQKLITIFLWGLFFSFFLFNCGEKDQPLAPYLGERNLGNIQIEEGAFAPKITWTGGYVSIFAVNRDTLARLDSSLIMLVYAPNNNIHYPVTFGQVPAGAQNLLDQYGGKAAERLEEDNTYTFWMLTDDAWQTVSQYPGKCIKVNPNSNSITAEVKNDSILANADSHAQSVLPLDVFVNLTNINSRGRLGELMLSEPVEMKDPVLTWKIMQEGVTDTMIAAMGLCEGAGYLPTAVVWEVWSEDFLSGNPVYGKNNVISAPVTLGQTFPGTKTFYEYPVEGLKRNQMYYLWIANKDWDGLKHGRAANYYAYISFETY